MAMFNKKSGSEGRRRRGAGKEEEEKKSGSGYKAKRSFSKNKSYREKSTDKRRSSEGGHDRPFKRGYEKSGTRPSRDNNERAGESGREGRGDRNRSTRDDRESKDRTFREERSGNNAPRDRNRPSRKFSERTEKDDRRGGERERTREDNTGRTLERGSRYSDDRERPRGTRDERAGAGEKKRRFSKPRTETDDRGRRVNYEELEGGKAFSRGFDKKEKKTEKGPPKKADNPDGLIRLNKYLSNAGIASRREADTLIQSGAVKVNGEVVNQLGYKIKPGDKVTYGDEAVRGERKVYLLLNKPKDYITTMDDPQERKTVIDLVRGACKERVYPVGRLDRNTTGLLLLTNDGELTTKLTHPKFGVKKVYHVSLNKGLKPDDFKKIVEGVELEDGVVKADDLAFVGEGKREVGIEIHSGRNRVVRRLFEQLGYDVLKLDRVVFAGLTKKDLPRGKHRFLTAKEISFLKMIG
jgi:23S rRNA pseudouridine2605 synthase